MRKFSDNRWMINEDGPVSNGFIVDSRYYNFVMARKILFFVSFFSRYLLNLYSYTKKKRFRHNKASYSKRFWRFRQ